MAWLFPSHAVSETSHQLDAALVGQATAGEALAQAASRAEAEAEDAVGRARRVADRAAERIRWQEQRHAERMRRAAADPSYAIVAGLLTRFERPTNPEDGDA